MRIVLMLGAFVRALVRAPARRVARSALSRRKARASFGTCKRYACAKVFAPTAGPPQERLEIAYDCVSRAAPEAVVRFDASPGATPFAQPRALDDDV